MTSSAVLSVNLTPLLDVVLQLITFFMMLVHFGTRLEGATKAVRLPLAPAALPGSDLTFDRLSVVMDARGRLKDGDRGWTRTPPPRGGPARRSRGGRASRRSATRPPAPMSCRRS